MKKHLLFFVLAVVFWSSCSEDIQQEIGMRESQLVSQNDAKLVYDWYELYLQIERNLEDFRPNPTSRALGYIGLAAYEAALPGMTDYRSADLVLNGYHTPLPNPYNEIYWSGVVENEVFWNAVLNHTYFRTFNHFLLNMDDDQINSIASLYQNRAEEYQQLMSSAAYNQAIVRANTAADAVIAYAQTDLEGEEQVLEVEPEEYQPPIGRGLWQPTSPDFKNACHPYWRAVRLMVTPDEGVPLEPHLPFSEEIGSPFYEQAKEVDDAVANLTFEDRWIAEFWSDDLVGVTFSPPARQVAIANQLIDVENVDLEYALRFYLRLGFVLNDASVICWGAKYVYNLERPVDYIRRVINPDFNPILGDALGITGLNPNFPAYPSGHSSFASAGTSVFKQFFGDVTSFTDRCHEGRTDFIGDPRTYTDFDDMAAENAYSRIPLGVHFRMDCDEGLRLGYEVGKYVTQFSLHK